MPVTLTCLLPLTALNRKTRTLLYDGRYIVEVVDLLCLLRDLAERREGEAGVGEGGGSSQFWSLCLDSPICLYFPMLLHQFIWKISLHLFTCLLSTYLPLEGGGAIQPTTSVV